MVELGPDWPPEGLRLRLGMWLNEQEEPEWAVWDPSTADPHCLVAGRPGRGKSVTLRVLLSQGLAAGWQIVIADPKGVDFRWTEDLPGVKWSGGDDAPEAIDAAHAEMEMRQQWMRDNAERTATDLMEVPDQPFQPMLVIADEAAELAGLGDKKRQERTKDKLGSLVRRGRFIGAMVCVATQRPDATFIPGEAKANLGTRVLCGEGDSQMYAMALESSPEEVPALSPPHRRGQGRVRIGGQPAREIQLAFVSPQAVLDAQQAAWPQKKHQDGAPLLVPPEWTQDNGAVPHDEGEEET
jgi:DNA segregation ATPase FtsK/SpoIIIE-like protein